MECNRLYDYKRHLESNKHKTNDKNNIENIKEIETAIQCDNCLKNFSCLQNMYRHKRNAVCKKADEKTEILDIIKVKDQELRAKDIEILEIKYQYELKLKDIIINSKDKVIEDLKNNVDNMTDIAKRSITALTYCRKNFPKAPPLLELEYHEPPKLLMDAVPKGIDIAKYLIDLYADSDKVSPLIANIIIAKYKKKDPTKMSFWNADHARQNFVFVDMLNGVAQWENDKDAIHIRSKVVDPMLTHVREMLVEFNSRIATDLANKDKTQLDDDLIEGVLISNLNNVSKYQERCMNMINRLDDKSFSNSIIKIIAAEFQIKYDTIEREIEKKEQKKKERRKAYNKRITNSKKSSPATDDTKTKVKKQMEEIAKKEQEALNKKIEADLDEEVRQKDLARKKQLEDRRKNEKVIKTYESDVD
jgi:hypothetical protein